MIALAIAGAAFLPPEPVLLVSIAWWILVAVLVISYPRLDDLWGRQPLILLMGFLMLVPGWVALSLIKEMEHSAFLICLLFFMILSICIKV